MAEGLRWFHGINGATSMRNIGWTYVLIAACLVVLIAAAVMLWRSW